MHIPIDIKPAGQVIENNSTKEIEIYKQHWPGLAGLEKFSHAIILWWGHLNNSTEKRNTLILNRPYKNGPDKLGVFATRSEIRPNPILNTIIEISSLDIKTGIITFPYIDAEAGSPVLDLKPYLPCSDKVSNPHTAQWAKNWPESYDQSATFDWSREFNF